MKYEFEWWHLLLAGALVLLFTVGLETRHTDESREAKVFDSYRFPAKFPPTSQADSLKVGLTIDETPSLGQSLFQTIYTGQASYDHGDVVTVNFEDQVWAGITCYSPQANYWALQNGQVYVEGFGAVTPVIGGPYPTTRSMLTSFVADWSLPLGVYDGFSWVSCLDTRTEFWDRNGCTASSTGICDTYQAGDPISTADQDYNIFELACSPSDAYDHTLCYGGTLWWYNDCNEKTFEEGCSGDETCPPGATECLTTCSGTHEYYACHTDGNVWSFDNCDVALSVYDSCDVWEGCSNSQCALLPDHCYEDTDCELGTICEGHTCVVGCRTNDNCPVDQGFTCLIPEGETTGGCQQTAECILDEDCDASKMEICKNDACVTVDCYEDSDCGESEYCTASNTCESQTGCTDDDGCNAGEICDDGTLTGTGGLCVAVDCTTDAECPINGVCTNYSCVVTRECTAEGLECVNNEVYECVEEGATITGTRIDICGIKEYCSAEEGGCITVSDSNGGGGGGSGTTEKTPYVVTSEEDTKKEKQERLLYIVLLGGAVYAYIKYGKKKKKKKKK